jgi:nucleoside-diphosphate-sugar epimerase
MIKTAKFFPIIGREKRMFQPIYVDDLVQALFLCMEKREVTAKRMYILAGNETTTFKEFIDLSAEFMGTKVVTFNIPEGLAWFVSNVGESIGTMLNHEPPITHSRVEFFTRDHVYDVSEIREDVGFVPKVDLKTGLYKTINWYRENGWL